MRHFLAASRLVPAGVSAVLATVLVGFGLRAATTGAGREPRQSTMGAVHRDAGRVAAALRTSTLGGALDDSSERDARRDEVLRRVDMAGASTYMPAMLAQVDSAIRRWPDDRVRRPLRIALANGPAVKGFRAEYVTSVSWSVNRWNDVRLPVQLEFRGGDTTRADIVVHWTTLLDSGRTGKADITWDQRQHIRRARVTLATHTPDGRSLTATEMTALALHEIGHALGLAHSGEAKDALYPMTRAADLTLRDRATARLLYELPAGSLR